jgi:hypothetical protein
MQLYLGMKGEINHSEIYVDRISEKGIRGSVVGWGTMLQAGS